NGNDNWSGTLPAPNRAKTDGPLASLSRVLCRLQHCAQGGTTTPDHFLVRERPAEPITVHLRGGVYPLEKPLVFGPEHSFPVTFKAYRNEKPVLSGAKRITAWRIGSIHGKTAWIADLPEVAEGKWDFRELYVNGRRAKRPRLPKAGLYRMKDVPGVTPATGWDWRHYDKFICQPGEVRAFENLKDIEVVYVHFWIEERSSIAAFDPETNKVTLARASLTAPVGSWNANLADYYLDNVFEALSEPGEWYLDRPAGRLYYLPRRGETPDTTVVMAPKCLQLIGLMGAPGENRFVEHIRFEGLTFAHTDWRHPDPSDGAADILGPDAEESKSYGRRLARGKLAGAAQAACDVPGVIYLKGARFCAIENCTIEDIGWYGVEIADGCHGVRVVGNTIRRMGAGGIKINGAAARDKNVATNKTGHHRISDNTISQGGRVFHSAVGILSMNAFAVAICHNHIFDLFYSGISCGWEWGYQDSVSRDNLIAYNHIHDLGHKLLSDMGGIYTLGVQPGTVIRNNLIHNVTSAHYGGWCIYPDEGSSHLLIENNICYDADRQPFHQHYGRRNVVRNNIWAFGGEAVSVYSRNEEHEGIIWTRNIMVSKGEPIFKGPFAAELDKHRIDADLNLYHVTTGKRPVFLLAGKAIGLKSWQAMGRDRHSIVADPKFRNIAKRDFSLAEDSPAFKLGFKQIDMSTVGPRPVSKRDTPE
ncbi:MAG: right-handed parallel beta-helix repeat-containing protein, partial [Kiritimatiellae bacterium]|nr:right-handed parallel beta-helix repeat-containing protein [Kiritimatiellia bacterium]